MSPTHNNSHPLTTGLEAIATDPHRTHACLPGGGGGCKSHPGGLGVVVVRTVTAHAHVPSRDSSAESWIVSLPVMRQRLGNTPRSDRVGWELPLIESEPLMSVRAVISGNLRGPRRHVTRGKRCQRKNAEVEVCSRTVFRRMLRSWCCSRMWARRHAVQSSVLTWLSP